MYKGRKRMMCSELGLGLSSSRSCAQSVGREAREACWGPLSMAHALEIARHGVSRRASRQLCSALAAACELLGAAGKLASHIIGTRH